jgi:hypothetical protein
MVDRSSFQSQPNDTQLCVVFPRALPPPAGYAAPAAIQGSQAESDRATLALLAAKIRQDPLAMRKLSDRVFELLREDLQIERERNRGYGRRY